MANEKKQFHGVRTKDGARVWVQSKSAMLPLAPRNDVRDHSPDGFEWGYGGSGPAQLALAICLELLAGEERGVARALQCYQDVKWRFVGTLAGDVWTLEAEEVRAYIRELEAKYAGQAELRAAFDEEARKRRPHEDARVRQAEGDAYGVDNEPT